MLNLRNPRQLLDTLFLESAAGIQISADSGAGKSNVAEVLLRQMIRQGLPLFVLDPHGSLVESLRNYILDCPPRIRHRLVWVEPGNTKRVTIMNPLAVPTTGNDEFTWQALLTKKCGHTAKILLTIWEQESFAGTPRLAKWVARLLHTLGAAGLALADVRHFLDIGSPVYRSLIRAVPDLVARQEFSELSEMRPTDRENLIESTKNRFLGFLENPIIEATFGLVDGALDVAQLYREGSIVLINLAPQGVLRDEDQMILANLWLSEILHAVFNLPASERRPAFVAIDELPVFHACSSLLGGSQGALTQVRKFLLRFLCCHQGALNFPNGKEDRLLNNLIGQCGVGIYLRHANPTDARFFGEIVALPQYDPMKVKHKLVQSQQYQAGNQLVTLVDESMGSSDGESQGGGESEGVTATDSWNTDEARTTTESHGETRDDESLRQAVTNARTTARSQRNGRGGSTAKQSTTSSSWQRTSSTTKSQTWKQTLVPILKWRDVLTSVTFFTAEEQLLEAASRFPRLATGTAIVRVSGKGVAEVRFPLIRNPFRNTPKYFARKLAAFQQECMQLPGTMAPRSILEARNSILNELLAQLNALTFGEELFLGKRSKDPALPGPSLEVGDTIDIVPPDAIESGPDTDTLLGI